MIFTVLIVSAVAGLLATRLVRAYAMQHKIGVLPNARMVHQGFVPVMGGLGIFCGFAAGLLTAYIFYPHQLAEFWSLYWGILAASLIIIVTGIYDDLKGLNAPQKFFMQFIAVTVIMISDCYIKSISLPSVSLTLQLGWFAIPFTYLWIIGVSNAINLLDGLDGLAGGVSLIATVVFFAAGFDSGNVPVMVLTLALAGGLLGFLRYNHHPASIFMGDTGSLFLGLFLSALAIRTFQGETGQVALLSPVIALAIPIGDTLVAFFRRLNQGHHPFQPDKDHLHHRLMYLGLTHAQTVYIIYLAAIIYGAIVVIIRYQTPFFSSLLLLLILIITLLGLNRVGYLEARKFDAMGKRLSAVRRASQTAPLSIRRVLHKLLLVLSDLIMINLAWYLTWLIRFRFQLLPVNRMVPFSEIALSPVALIMTVVWLTLFVLNDLYRQHWDVSRFDQVISLSKTVLFGSVILFLITMDVNNPVSEGRLSVGIYAVFMIFMVNSGRLILIFLEKKFSILEYRPHPTLLIGATEKARKLLRDIRNNSHLLYQPVGYVHRERTAKKLYGLTALGEYKDIPELIRTNGITEVIIAINDRTRDELMDVIALAEHPSVAIKIIPQMHNLVSGRKTQEMIGHPLIRVFPTRMKLWQRFVKRSFDITGALAIMILSIPFVVMVFALQVVYGVYPPYRITNVVGRNGSVFGLLNLALYGTAGRANLLSGILLKTRFYKFPALINILLGKMSFVGPRPETVADVEFLSQKIKFYYRRFQVRPGLTGWAQVKYRYDESVKTKRDQFRMDLFYLENMSLMFDARILLRSAKVFFFGR